jgi:WD40 repeat protein
LGRQSGNTSDLLNASDGTVIKQLTRTHNRTNAMVFTLDDQYLISGVGSGGSYRTLSLWNVATGLREMLLANHTNGTFSLSLSQDGQYLATSGDYDREVNVWHVPDLTMIETIPNSDPITGQLSRVKDVAFSPDGQRVASCDYNGVRVRNALDGTLLFSIPSNAEVFALAVSPDGQYIAGAVPSEQAVKLWRASDGTLVRTLNVDTPFEYPTIVFSPSGTSIAAGYNTGSDGGAITFWRVSDGRVASLETRSGAVVSIAFDPSGKMFAYTQFDGLVVLARTPEV